jgi:FKBP-type peptidyl-prolyl cis-trans isomerase
MTHTQYITTAIAVSLAVIVAIGLMFYGPGIFTPFNHTQSETETLTQEQSSTTPMDTQQPGNPSMGAQPGHASAAPQKLPTELTMTDTVVGTGAEAKAGQQVTVNYVGMLPDGTVFDASSKHGQAFTFALGAGQVIKGWDMGVAGMKVGGKRRLIIPPAYGYGAQGAGNIIPPNATLIFDVELVAVK